jgi:hypothetical protein
MAGTASRTFALFFRSRKRLKSGLTFLHTRAAGIGKLCGIYKPTERNQLVVDHNAKLGFGKVLEEATGLKRWVLLVEGATPECAPMKVISQGFATSTETFAT